MDKKTADEVTDFLSWFWILNESEQRMIKALIRLLQAQGYNTRKCMEIAHETIKAAKSK